MCQHAAIIHLKISRTYKICKLLSLRCHPPLRTFLYKLSTPSSSEQVFQHTMAPLPGSLSKSSKQVPPLRRRYCVTSTITLAPASTPTPPSSDPPWRISGTGGAGQNVSLAELNSAYFERCIKSSSNCVSSNAISRFSVGITPSITVFAQSSMSFNKG
jgi:hypothetical protein